MKVQVIAKQRPILHEQRTVGDQNIADLLCLHVFSQAQKKERERTQKVSNPPGMQAGLGVALLSLSVASFWAAGGPKRAPSRPKRSLLLGCRRAKAWPFGQMRGLLLGCRRA